MKQCVCGRSKAYPYCDGTHKLKKIDTENTSKDKDSIKND